MKITLTAITFNAKYQLWLETNISIEKNAELAHNQVSKYLLAGESLLTVLPQKLQRDQSQQFISDEIDKRCRNVRTEFMRNHAEWLYSKLTKNYTLSLRLSEIAKKAADFLPGLVPNEIQLKYEATLSQEAKHGKEIDHGILFWGLLRSAKVYPHLINSMLKPKRESIELYDQFLKAGNLSLQTVYIEKNKYAAHISINNTIYLNAEDDQLTKDLECAVDVTLLDESIHVCVLRGAVMNHPKYSSKRVFSSGINLNKLHQGQISFVEFILEREFGYINKILRGLIYENSANVFNKPWIAVVDNFAIGGGAQLLLVFDKVIACDDSYFCLPAANEGIIPGVANLRLPKIAGPRLAKQIILTGKKIHANGPYSQLIFDEVVNSNDIDAAIERAIDEFSNPAVKANRFMLNLCDESIAEFANYMAGFSLEQAKRLYSCDVLNKTW